MIKWNQTKQPTSSSQMAAFWNDSQDSEAQARFDMEAKHQAGTRIRTVLLNQGQLWLGWPVCVGKQSFFFPFRQAILRDLEQLRAEKEQVLLTDAQQSNARIENCQDYWLVLNCQSRLSLKNCSLEKASTGQFQDVPSWLLLLHWSKAWTILNLRQWCFRIVQNLQDSIQTEHSTLQAQSLCKCYCKQYCNLLCFHVSCPSISPVPCPADGTPKTPSWAKQASWHLTFWTTYVSKMIVFHLYKRL